MIRKLMILAGLLMMFQFGFSLSYHLGEMFSRDQKINIVSSIIRDKTFNNEEETICLIELIQQTEN